MSMMLTRVVKAAAAVTRTRSAVGVAALQTRAFASDASDAGDKKQQREQRPPREQRSPRGPPAPKGDAKDSNEQPRSTRTFSFALKDKNRGDDKRKGDQVQYSPNPAGNDESSASDAGPAKPKKFSFAPSVTAEEQTPELEVFDAPAYWDEDFPAEFDDAMKHEVEKLEVFADFTMLIDSSWQKEIHPLFDGEAIEMTLNAPLEDFEEHLFIDDKNTFDTKVVMEVPLSCFKGLTREGLEFVKQLAGPRYQPNKKQLKLTEDRYRTRVHNHKRLCDILRDLTQTAHELATAQVAEEAKQ